VTLSRFKPVDLLLLNTSNYPSKEVYPYAFVQVSAVARRFGLCVARFDFVGLKPRKIRAKLTALLQQYQPRMIGLHLRQADTVVESDYRLPPGGDPASYYLPVDDTRDLVRWIRSQTPTPIVVGGFGFTTHPLRIARRLAVDFGVLGEPDAFFERFEDVLARNSLDQIPNLVYRRGGVYHETNRVFFPPSAQPEYTREIIDELVRFQRKYPGKDGNKPHVPVEISRGCPCRCYFCAEPFVKGRKVRIRDWDVVERDIRALDRRGLHRIWLVCSEINFDRKFSIEIARHMAALNRGRSPATMIRWRAYNLPRMSRRDLRTMIAGGFEPGWNDFASFEDRNLQRCRVPYRAADAIAYCRDFHDLAGKFSLNIEDIRTFYMFLGNAFSDARTIRTTLRRVDEWGLKQHHDAAVILAATRVFEMEGALNCGDGKSIFTAGRKGKTRVDIVGPTFHFSPDLVSHLGSETAVREFFDYVGETFLSTHHQDVKDWPEFLRCSVSAAGLRALMSEAKQCGPVESVEFDVGSDPVLAKRVQHKIARLWSQNNGNAIHELMHPGMKKGVSNFVAHGLLIQLLSPKTHAFKRILRYLGIPCDRDGFYDLSEYRVAELLYRRYRSNEELIADVRQHFNLSANTLDLLQLEYLLFDNNVRIRPEYRELLFGIPYLPP
jgi:hypothetical protein